MVKKENRMINNLFFMLIFLCKKVSKINIAGINKIASARANVSKPKNKPSANAVFSELFLIKR